MDCAVDSLEVGCHKLLSAAAKLYRVVAVKRGWCSSYAGVGWCLYTQSTAVIICCWLSRSLYC